MEADQDSKRTLTPAQRKEAPRAINEKALSMKEDTDEFKTQSGCGDSRIALFLSPFRPI